MCDYHKSLHVCACFTYFLLSTYVLSAVFVLFFISEFYFCLPPIGKEASPWNSGWNSCLSVNYSSYRPPFGFSIGSFTLSDITGMVNESLF